MMSDAEKLWKQAMLAASKENINSEGEIGDLIRKSHLRDLTWRLQVSHSDVRQSSMTRARKALRCASILIQDMNIEQLSPLLKAANISDRYIEIYFKLAQRFPDILTGVISEKESILVNREIDA